MFELTNLYKLLQCPQRNFYNVIYFVGNGILLSLLTADKVGPRSFLFYCNAKIILIWRRVVFVEYLVTGSLFTYARSTWDHSAVAVLRVECKTPKWLSHHTDPRSITHSARLEWVQERQLCALDVKRQNDTHAISHQFYFGVRAWLDLACKSLLEQKLYYWLGPPGVWESFWVRKSEFGLTWRKSHFGFLSFFSFFFCPGRRVRQLVRYGVRVILSTPKWTWLDLVCESLWKCNWFHLASESFWPGTPTWVRIDLA